MNNELELTAALTHAEAALADRLIALAKSGAIRSATLQRLDVLCIYFRQLRDALVELSDSALANKVETPRTRCRAVRAVLLELNPLAAIPFHCLEPSCPLLSSPRTTCWRNQLEGVIAAPGLLEMPAINSTGAANLATEQAIPHPKAGLFARSLIPRGAIATKQIARHTVGLSALVLAYLTYFHVDVQLQIVSIRSIFP